MSGKCRADCRCTKYLEAIAIDTSHVAVLARATGSATTSLREVIESHTCGGVRTVFTSAEIFFEEMDQERPGCPLAFIAGDQDLANALEPIERREHSESLLDGLVGHRPLAPDSRSEIELRRRDGTLVAVAEDFDGAVVVADDEHVLRWLELSIDDGETSVHAIPSLTLLGSMNACGAVSDELLESSLEAEGDYHKSRDVSPWIVQRKLERVRTEMNRLVRRRAEAEVA